MIKGLRTVIYHVSDLAKAKKWYSEVLGQQPYFDQPFYVGYSVGGFELGLLPDGKSGVGGSVAYWGVDNAGAVMARLEAMDAPVIEKLQDVGEGIKVATVADPFGNPFGIIENPHFSVEKVR
jgi:predicted enzyme related to lactoylglutathione lyase